MTGTAGVERALDYLVEEAASAMKKYLGVAVGLVLLGVGLAPWYRSEELSVVRILPFSLGGSALTAAPRTEDAFAQSGNGGTLANLPRPSETTAAGVSRKAAALQLLPVPEYDEAAERLSGADVIASSMPAVGGGLRPVSALVLAEPSVVAPDSPAPPLSRTGCNDGAVQPVPASNPCGEPANPMVQNQGACQSVGCGCGPFAAQCWGGCGGPCLPSPMCCCPCPYWGGMDGMPMGCCCCPCECKKKKCGLFGWLKCLFCKCKDKCCCCEDECCCCPSRCCGCWPAYPCGFGGFDGFEGFGGYGCYGPSVSCCGP